MIVLPVRAVKRPSKVHSQWIGDRLVSSQSAEVTPNRVWHTGRTYFRASARFSSPSGSTRKPICASGYSSSL